MFRVIGILVFALLTSVIGGVAAVWALGARSASVEDCQADMLCSFASSWLRMGGSAPGGSACLSEDDKRAMALLASVLVNLRPVEDTATTFLGSVTASCPSVSEVAIRICQAASGGNAGLPEACSEIGEATLDGKQSQ